MYSEIVFSGVIAHRVYDSNCCMIRESRMPIGYSDPETIRELEMWLDRKDPVEPPERASIPSLAAASLSALLSSGATQVMA